MKTRAELLARVLELEQENAALYEIARSASNPGTLFTMIRLLPIRAIARYFGIHRRSALRWRRELRT